MQIERSLAKLQDDLRPDSSNIERMILERFLRNHPTVALREAKKEEIQSGEAISLTTTSMSPIRFARIDFEHPYFSSEGDPEREIYTKFSIQQTSVTQLQFWYVMKRLPKHIYSGPYLFSGGDRKQRVFGSPNHPVTGFTAEDLDLFFLTVNTWAEEDDPKIYQLIAEHKPHHRYRLPQRAEWVHAEDWIKTTMKRGDSSEFRELKYAVLSRMSDQKVGALEVGQKLAHYLPSGDVVYDFFGNVWEVAFPGNTAELSELFLPNRIHKTFVEKEGGWLGMGGSYNSNLHLTLIRESTIKFSFVAKKNLGFRMIRTDKPAGSP